MIDRVHIIPVGPMARRLAKHHPRDRRVAESAAMILRREGYMADDIARGLTAAMAQAERLVAAGAGEHPVALAIGYARDLLALAVLIGAGAYGWGVLS